MEKDSSKLPQQKFFAKTSTPPMDIISPQKTATQTTATTFAAAAVLTAAGLAASLSIGFFAASPLLLQQAKMQFVRMAGDASPPRTLKDVPDIHLAPSFSYAELADGFDAEAFDLQLVPDGGFVIAGQIKKNGGEDLFQPYLAKVYGPANAPGATPEEKFLNLLRPEWNTVVTMGTHGLVRSVAVAYNQQSTPHTVTGYAVAGFIFDEGDIQAYTLQFQPNGTEVNGSLKTYGVRGPMERAYSISQVFTASGNPDGFVVAGQTVDLETDASHIMVAKTTVNGSLDAAWPQNPKYIARSTGDVAYAVRQAFTAQNAPDGYIVVGETLLPGDNKDGLLIKLTGNGSLDPAWPRTDTQELGLRTFGDANGQDLRDVEIKLDGNGNPAGYVAAGRTAFNAPVVGLISKPSLLLADLQGSTIVFQTLQKDTQETGIARTVEQTFTADGKPNGYLIGGEIQSIDWNAVILRTDYTGAELWYWRPESGIRLNAAKQVSDGSFLVTGKTFAKQGFREEPIPGGDIFLSITDPEPVPPPAEPALQGTQFRRSDANMDKNIDITDAVFTLSHLFLGGETPPCMKAADANGDGKIDITDAVVILGYLFLGGGIETIPAPGPLECGFDPTPDDLTCDRYERCP